MKQKLLNNLRLRAVWLVAMILCSVTGAWAQAPLNTELWKETWTNGANGTTPSAYNFSGTTVYGGASLTYAQSSDNTKLYAEVLAGGTSPELLLSKSNQTWTISNIPTGQATEMLLTFVSNKNTFAVTSSSEGITIDGSAKEWTITATSDVDYFNLTIKNTGSSNARIDDIILKVTTAGTGGSDTPDERDEVNMQTFTADATTLLKGATTATTVTNDQEGWTASYTYSSNNTSVATVDGNGVITAVAKGVATITATLNVDPEDENYKAGSTKSKTIDITVNNPIHIATFSINGNTDDTEEYEEGENIVFPTDLDDVESKKFVGWVAEAISGVTDEAPDFVTSATMGESDVTYYAVFATVEGGAVASVTDELTRATTGVTGTSYADWSGKTATSDAAYAGQSAGGNESIQLRSNNNNSGVITTTSGGKATKVVVEWNSNTADGRTINIYGSNDAYSSASDLYGANAGTLIGTIVCGTSTELTINDDYAYIGIRSANGALYLNSISITWSAGSASVSAYCTTVAADTREEAEIAFADEEVTKEIVAGYTGQALTNPNDLEVTYTSSNEEVATVDEDGVLTVLAVGETTITATFAGNEDYKAGVASYVLTIQDSREAIDLAFDEESVEVNVEESVDAPALSGNTGNGAVTYSSSNTEIATVDAETGEVTGVADGEATITATVAATNEYQGGTATFTVTVIDPNKKGTATNPYSVAEARAAIDAGTGVTGVYATGIVSQIVTAYNSTYGNISYNISADGLTTSDQLQAYRGFDKDGEWFTSADDVQVGDVVVIYGNLKKYNSTYEFDQNNQRYSYSRKDEAGLAYETEAYNANLGEAFATPELTNPNSLTVTYSSSDESVATVDAEGAVTLVAAGETTITASFAGNSSFRAGEASYTLTVIDPNEPVDICELVSITPTTLTIGDIDNFVLTANFVDGVVEGEDYEITWTSSDPAVLDLTGTTYKAVAAGTVTITVNVEVYDEDTYNNVSKEFTVKVEAPKTWVDLVSEYDGEYYAMNKEFSNGTYQSTKVDVVNGKVINGEANDISWSIEASGNGVSIQNRTTEKFVGYSSSTNLTKSADPYEWTVDEENNSWTVSTTRSIIMNSSYGFKAYAISNLQPNQTGYANIYTTAYTFASGYTREVTAGNFGTICLPYDVEVGDFSGVKFYQIVAKKMNGNNVTSVVLSDEVTSLVGGAAYIYQANADAVKLIAAYSGDEVAEPFDAELSETGLTGTYEAAYIPQGKYVLKDNTLFFVNQSDYVKSGANKAYIDLDNVPEADANVKGTRIDVSNDYLTGINGFDVDGRQNVIFNLSGQRVSNANKGVYIVNGKKISVK